MPVIAVGLFVMGGNLVLGKVSETMNAVRDQPVAAAAMGIDNSLLKTETFGVGAMYTAVADALGASPRTLGSIWALLDRSCISDAGGHPGGRFDVGGEAAAVAASQKGVKGGLK